MTDALRRHRRILSRRNRSDLWTARYAAVFFLLFYGIPCAVSAGRLLAGAASPGRGC